MRRFAAVTAAYLVCAGLAEAARADDLERLAAANAAAVESIRTLHCKVRIDDASNRFGISGGEYWRSGDKIRLQWTHRGNLNQAVIRDGLVRNLVKQDVGNSPNMKAHSEVKESLEGGRYFWHGTVERYTGASPFSFDPWLAAMCSTSDNYKMGNVSFAEFARSHAKEARAVRRSEAGGAPTEVVEFKLGDAVCSDHFDPAANFMVRKIERASDSSDGYSSSSEVTSFKEFAPGVFFPERVVVKRHQGGKDEADEVFSFSEVSVNKPIPDSVFDQKYRPGITVTDRVEGKKYKINAEAKPVGAKSPILVAAPLPVDPTVVTQTPQTVTQDEPARSGWWLLPASLALIAGAGILLLVRRRRND